MDLAEKRMKEAVDALIDDIDQSYLRGIHKKMFVCSSDCYDRSVNRNVIETCVQGCSKSVNNATSILQKELDDLQAQLNRCGMTCLDKATQKFGPDPAKYTEIQSKEFDKQLSNCACSCVDDHIKLLPNIRKRLSDSYQRFLK